ncbi:MAG: molybdopterin molybdotransferase MoeA [Planctomycetaceae bacterium]
MLSVEQAIAAILQEVEPRPSVEVSLDEARGLVLAADVASDVDSPPFDKAQMDGFAVRAEDTSSVPRTLQVIEEVTAGSVPERVVVPGQASRIMTGAPMPEGADTVVPIEQCDFQEGANCVTVQSSSEPGACIVQQGTSMAKGETVLVAGTQLSAASMGLLAELGQARVSVLPRPTVGILATGDELVPVDVSPGPGQIRNSNQTMLVAQVAQAGADTRPLGIARDEREHLKALIAQGLECDILCLSGGVSAGKLDLVPSELVAAGVRQVFHKVNMKPGKPVWFGRLDAERTADGRPRWIFGLPGNPVSSMVCFELFVRTALRKLMGITPADPQPVKARLESAHTTRGDRPTYLPANLQWTNTCACVRPANWQGSFDLRATANANAMILFPAGDRKFAAGEQVDVIPW